MTDREKVIKGLEYCAVGCRSECPYFDIVDYCAGVLCADALALLKAQEPMLVVSKDTNEIIGDCPRCGRHVIHWHNKYCAECRQAVKWE